MPQETLKLLTVRMPAPQFDPAQGADGLPKRIRVLAWGRNETTQGPVIVNETTVKLLPAYNAAQNWDRPYFDFEHSSIPSSPTYRGEPVKIAATGEFLDKGGVEIVPGEGVYMLAGSYTPEGAALLPAGHYPDLSPVVKVNAQNELIGLHSCAFCRQGATVGLIFLSISTTAKPASMDKNKPQNADELMKVLAETLSLSADATPADVLTALMAALERPEAAPANEEVRQLTASVNDLVKMVKDQGDTIKLLSAAQEASERGTIMAAAVREGKVVPDMAKSLPLDQLKLLCAQLPVTVPMGQRQTDATLLLSGSPIVDPELTKLDAEMGITEEDRKKFL
ncbi:MAG: phage protease [Prosthecobacter sp.]|nr:phage protease [Prosthecobacter sp.]